MSRCPLWEKDTEFKTALIWAREFIRDVRSKKIPRRSAEEILKKIESTFKALDKAIVDLDCCPELDRRGAK